MSRDTDRDLSDDLNGPYVQAACVDCGADVVVDYDPAGALCDECCEQREMWAAATESRMAKANLPSGGQAVSPVVVDVALVPVSPIAGPVVEVALVPMPAGYLAWLDALRANAHYGSDALAHAWYVSPVPFTEHLLTVAPDLWLTLKAIARRAA